jgi:putative flippase GtrA
VSSIGELYARFRQLIHEGFKFLVIGAVGAIVTFGAANALHSVGKYKAITIATILATVITYLGNRYWTFAHREGKGTTRDSTMFFFLNGVGLVIYWGCIGIVDLAGLGKSVAWYNVALVVGTGLGTLFRFWSYRRWIWIETPVLAPDETIEERAEDIAAMVGAIPIMHHAANGNSAHSASSHHGLMNGALANGASAEGASASWVPGNRDPAGAESSNGDSANGAAGPGSGPHRHARPGGPSIRPAADRQAEPGRAPASHRRTP